MEIGTLFGLPAHPFLVHAPLVLIPLIALAVIVAMVRDATVRRWTAPLAGACLVLLALTQLAIGSGEAFKEMGDERNSATIVAHQTDAELLRLILLGLTGILVVLAIVDRRARRAPAKTEAVANDRRPIDRRSFLRGALRVLAGGAAMASIVSTFETGHTGASSVWNRRDDGENGGPGGDGESIAPIGASQIGTIAPAGGNRPQGAQQSDAGG